jgi:hypothetical protein
MDTTERILKLVALGWDGKEDELEFFQRVYGLQVEIIPEDEMMEVVLTYKIQRKTAQHRIKFKKKKNIRAKKAFLILGLVLFVIKFKEE